MPDVRVLLLKSLSDEFKLCAEEYLVFPFSKRSALALSALHPEERMVWKCSSQGLLWNQDNYRTTLDFEWFSIIIDAVDTCETESQKTKGCLWNLDQRNGFSPLLLTIFIDRVTRLVLTSASSLLATPQPNNYSAGSSLQMGSGFVKRIFFPVHLVKNILL